MANENTQAAGRAAGDTDGITLEQTFSRIEEITKALENPETSLEDSFALYQEGSTLLAAANQKIDMVQKQVQILQHDQHSSEMDVLEDSEWVE